MYIQENSPPESVLKDLAAKYSNRDSHVTIATCNVANNDVPVPIYSVPTIKLYPAHNKRTPIEYFGETDDVKQYVDFIETESQQDSKSKSISRTNSPTTSEIKGKGGM